MGISLGLSVIGALVAYFAYIRRSIQPQSFVGTSGFVYSFYNFFAHRWYINAIYYRGVVYPVERASTWLFDIFEQKVIEPINIGASEFGGSVSDALRRIQSGVEEEYVLAFGIGIALLVLLLVLFGQV